MLRFAGVVRKSPTNKRVSENVDLQKRQIVLCCDRMSGGVAYSLDWFVDVGVKGDDPNRPELLRLFGLVGGYDFAVADVVDRYVRSWLGIKWLMEFFATNDGNSPHSGCRLVFAREMSSLYKSDGCIDGSAFFVFSIMCIKAYSELLDIRRRTDGGRAGLRGTPAWKDKYPGRKKGSKNKV